MPPGDFVALTNALNLLVRDPARRAALGHAAFQRLQADFSMEPGIARIAARLRASLGLGADATRQQRAAE